MSYRQIAAAWGVSKQCVMQYDRRALAKLREALRDLQDE